MLPTDGALSPHVTRVRKHRLPAVSKSGKKLFASKSVTSAPLDLQKHRGNTPPDPAALGFMTLNTDAVNPANLLSPLGNSGVNSPSTMPGYAPTPNNKQRRDLQTVFDEDGKEEGSLTGTLRTPRSGEKHNQSASERKLLQERQSSQSFAKEVVIHEAHIRRGSNKVSRGNNSLSLSTWNGGSSVASFSRHTRKHFLQLHPPFCFLSFFKYILFHQHGSAGKKRSFRYHAHNSYTHAPTGHRVECWRGANPLLVLKAH